MHNQNQDKRVAVSFPEPETNNSSPDSELKKNVAISLEQTPVNKQMSAFSG